MPSVIIRLQNLPNTAHSEDIRRYFSGLNIIQGGVHIVGGEMGDAFIGFSTDEDARLAMEKDGGKILETQFKLRLSSRNEFESAVEKAKLASNQSTQAPPHYKVMMPPFAVDSDRRRVLSSSPGRNNSPPRDPRRRPESLRRSSRKRERSRSPTWGFQDVSRDAVRRNDRVKTDDLRYDEQRDPDGPYSSSDRSHSLDTQKYRDISRQPAMNGQGECYESGNQGYCDSHGSGSNCDVSNSKEKRLTLRDLLIAKYVKLQQQTTHLPNFNSCPNSVLPQPFNSPSYKQPPAEENKESSVPASGDEFGNPPSVLLRTFMGSSLLSAIEHGAGTRSMEPGAWNAGTPRRSCFEPSLETPFPQSNMEQKPSESIRKTMPYFEKTNTVTTCFTPTEYLCLKEIIQELRTYNLSKKRDAVLEQPVQKNGNVLQVVPTDLESSPTYKSPPAKMAPIVPEQSNNPLRNSLSFASNEMRNEPAGGAKNPFPNAKQWPTSTTVEVRGIPPDLRMEEVLDIFRHIPLIPAKVCIVSNNRGAEKALIKFMKVPDFEEAIKGQPRYIRNYRCEIVPSSDAAFESASNAPKPRYKPRPREEDLCVELRGLPYSCKEEDIARFFEGLTIVDMLMESCNGIAIVQLATYNDFRTALTMNGKTMGQRYITISVASKEYIVAARGVSVLHQNQISKSPPRGAVPPSGNSNNNLDAARRPNSAPDGPQPDQGPPQVRPQSFCIYLTGLSERVTNKAIADFFNESGIVVKAIHLMLTPEKVPNGEGFIAVSTKEEGDLALSKNNSLLLGERMTTAPISFQEMTNILNGRPALPPFPPGPAPLFKTPGHPPRPRIPQPRIKHFRGHPLPEYPPSDILEFGHPFNGRPGPRGERLFPPGGGECCLPDFPRVYRPHPDIPPFFNPRGENPPPEYPPGDFQEFDHSPNCGPGPRGERPFPLFSPGGGESRLPDFPRVYRPHPDIPPVFNPRGENPPPEHPPGDFQEFDHSPYSRPGPRGERPFPPFSPGGGERHRPDFPRNDRPRPDFRPERPPFFYPQGERPTMDGPPMRGMRPPMEDPMRPPFGRMRGPFPPRPRGPWDPRAIEQGDIGAPGCVVGIDNLHFDAGLEEILDFFKGYGLTKDNFIRKVNEHGQATSKAGVAFHTPWDAEKVVRKLNYKTIMGRSVKLSLL